MAKETVQAVRQAELDALQKEREALQKKDSIIAEAEQQAKLIINSSIKQAMEKAENDFAKAKQHGEEIANAARLKAEDEVLLMKEMASRKEEAAIKLVLSSVLYE